MDVPTKLIVGLGNPGKEYAHTRHNIGFDVVDALAAQTGISVTRRDCRSLVGNGTIGNTRVYLLKPMTYMNLSGEAVAAFLRQKPLPLADLLVVADDISLPVGKIRLRATGSAGGHNGLKSLIAHLNGQDFPRLRIGVGAPGDAAIQLDHVLGSFGKAERKIVDDAVITATAALDCWITEGIERAMNRYNGSLNSTD